MEVASPQAAPLRRAQTACGCFRNDVDFVVFLLEDLRTFQYYSDAYICVVAAMS